MMPDDDVIKECYLCRFMDLDEFTCPECGETLHRCFRTHDLVKETGTCADWMEC